MFVRNTVRRIVLDSISTFVKYLTFSSVEWYVRPLKLNLTQGRFKYFLDITSSTSKKKIIPFKNADLPFNFPKFVLKNTKRSQTQKPS